ncbi:hypothetical protein NRF20_42610 [Streptomyces sp. R-74717]|uniref:hypothetical protein n=1 Tax=Streptomyces TaxID=1883 RepID=UPI0037AAC260
MTVRRWGRPRGGLPFETAERRLAEGSVLALGTDGLLQAPDPEPTQGQISCPVAWPAPHDRSSSSAMPTTLLSGPRSGDAALLIARPRPLQAGRAVRWELPVDPAQVARARTLTTRQLADRGLKPPVLSTELMVSELVFDNAIRHVRGRLSLSLIRAEVLICEVSDGSLSASHLRRAHQRRGRPRG